MAKKTKPTYSVATIAFGRDGTELWLNKRGEWGPFKERARYKTQEKAEEAVAKHHPGFIDFGIWANSVARRMNPSEAEVLMARKRNKRKRNQGRHYSNEEWLEYMLEGELDSEKQAVRDGEHEFSSECYDDVYRIGVSDIKISGTLLKTKKAYERDLRKALKEWGRKHGGELDVDALMDDGAAGDVFLTLQGAGVGIWDGRWDDHMAHVRGWDEDKMTAYLEKRLGKYVDDSGAGKLPDEMRGAIYDAFAEVCDEDEIEENPSPARRPNPSTASTVDLIRRLKF